MSSGPAFGVIHLHGDKSAHHPTRTEVSVLICSPKLREYAIMMTIEEIRAACARSEPVHLGDPSLARFSMPLHETFYPFGFPLQIETNCEEVLNARPAAGRAS